MASEPYGVVEETEHLPPPRRRDAGRPRRTRASRGQVVVLDGAAAGTLDGIARWAYDGTDAAGRPTTSSSHAEITTRDIDRGDYPHFLLKEISEAPASFRKTLRGKLVDGPDGAAVAPRRRRPARPTRAGRAAPTAPSAGSLVIGQGTAAVAGQSLADGAGRARRRHRPAGRVASSATELSGFGLPLDMADTLVVAISQCGTTTDTNRTVDLVRARGGT